MGQRPGGAAFPQGSMMRVATPRSKASSKRTRAEPGHGLGGRYAHTLPFPAAQHDRPKRSNYLRNNEIEETRYAVQ